MINLNINERIRFLRKEKLNITQEAFGEPLGLTRANIANIEAGRISVTERVIIGIQDKYNINNEWLRTGEGEIFIQLDKEEELFQWAGKLQGVNDSFKKRFVKMLMSLNEDEWELLEQKAKELVNSKDDTFDTSKKQLTNFYNNIPNTPEEFEKMYPPIEHDTTKKNNVG